MCYDVKAQPPDLPASVIVGAAASDEDLVLKSADGAEFAAYLARAGVPNGAGVVILPDVRGLHQFYKELATRFADAGVEAIAIDYFGRTAGLTPRDDSFDFWPHVAQTRAENIAADVAAAVAHLRALPNSPRAIFTVGFCFGGANSFLQAANKHGLAGVIGFYGQPVGPMRTGGPAPIDRVKEYECPVLGLFGGADPAIPEEKIRQFDAALTEAGIAHELITYPGAPHSFFDRRYEEYAKESADAWQRMLTFMRAHTPPR
jgi:carboxymethylenebutenolidase